MAEIKYIDSFLIGKKYKPNTKFDFRLAIPCVDVDEFALLIEHDWQNDVNVTSMAKLADEGKAPYCVSLGVVAGVLLLPCAEPRNMRMNNYDMFDREYGDFLVYELIPYVEETYGIKISKSPDMHYLSGGSSGGISAFTVAWFHPEYFHRIYMSSPSFLAMGRGNEIPYLIRKYETKPFRIYMEVSENEPNDYFGWSRAIDEQTREALIFANYDFKYAFFENEGHCSRYRNEQEAYIRNEWIWQDWKDKQITAPSNSKRVDAVIPFGSKWQKCDCFPTVTANSQELLSKNYELVSLSNDELVWYAANRSEDLIYAHVNDENISMENRIVHAILHTIPRQKILGAIDMAVAQTDRLFVLTEIGIQCVRSFGLIDVILDLPDNSKPQKIAISDALYVKTESGIYKRELCEECVIAGEMKCKQISYYD